MVGHTTARPRPFVVAHRAGNDLALLRRAEALPAVRLVEADVHLFHGRLEVRHLKTLGPVPILWDRWELAAPWTPRLVVDRLLAGAAPDTELMLDLKGRDRRLSERLVAALAATARDDRRLTICSRTWSLLEPFAAVPGIRVVHSVGSARQLAALRDRFDGRRLAGVSIHRKLLDPDVVADLRERTDMLITWPVADAGEARRLAAWGVDGVISESFETIAADLHDDRALEAVA
jgi:glycerophosphoryl diester phosphodiesterase